MNSEAGSESEDEEYELAASKLKKSEINYWTKVQTHQEMSKEKQPSYIINTDLDSLLRNKLYTKECAEGAQHYSFDIDDYPLTAPELVPANYALAQDELKEFGSLVNKLRM